jgi:hypothetical protein
MAQLDARAERIAGALGVEQIDLMPVLEPSLTNYYDYFHLTPAGARSVAAVVAQTLLQERRAPVAVEGGVSTCVGLRAS